MKMQASLSDGGIHCDERGKLLFFNQLDLSPVRRMYFVEHPDTNVVRAWQAHRREQKWMMVLSGSFTVVIVQPDDWETPSEDLVAESFKLSAGNSQVLHIPGGYANGFKADTANSKMMIFSDFTVAESSDDNYRYDKKLWYNW